MSGGLQSAGEENGGRGKWDESYMEDSPTLDTVTPISKKIPSLLGAWMPWWPR